MRISIVTAAYNIEQYVHQTIASVIANDRDSLEYIFIDGASSDGTLEIARKYQDAIDVLISEPDEGQYHAIAKGFEASTGDIMAWLNADDLLMPWTVSTVVEIFRTFPEVDWITGVPSYLNARGQMTRMQSKLPAYPANFVGNGWYSKVLGGYLQQESMFWRRSLWEKSGGLDLKYKLAADFELWTKFGRHARLTPVNIPLAAFRERPGLQRSSAGARAYEAEVEEICSKLKSPPRLWEILSARGLVARSAARLLIAEKAPAIIYDRTADRWTQTSRLRSISRLSLSDLIDEWFVVRSRQSELDR